MQLYSHIYSAFNIQRQGLRLCELVPQCQNWREHPYFARGHGSPWPTFDYGSVYKACKIVSFSALSFLDPEGSLRPTTVVLLVLLVLGVVTRLRKMPIKALLILNGKLRNFPYTFVTSFPTDLSSYFIQRGIL